MDALWGDVTYGVRRLLKNPGFSAIAIVTLALGIGATTAIYSVVDGLLLRPFPFKDPERLHQVLMARPGGHFIFGLSYESFSTWQRQPDLFEQFEAYDSGTKVFIGTTEPERIGGASVTGGLMSLLGVPPLIGRTITPDDVKPGAPRVAVLSHTLWKTRFGGTADVLGQRLRLDDGTFEVVGVMPPRFIFPLRATQIWVPLPVEPPAKGLSTRFQGIARLKPGITRQQTQARADQIAADLERARPSPRGWKIGVQAMGRVNSGVRRALYILFGAVGFVLIIACVNVANLLLVQAAGREREVGIRGALGASRARLVRQLLTESLMVAIAGGAAGLMFALWSVDLIVSAAPRDLTFFNLNTIAIDSRVLAFTTAATLLTGVFFGLVPAMRGSRASARDALKAGARTVAGSRRQHRLRNAFVVAQVALSLMLLVGAGLLVRTFIHVTRLNPGFDTHRLLALKLQLPEWKYSTDAARREFFARVLDRIASTPGVQAASLTGGMPPDGGGVTFGLQLKAEGQPPVSTDDDVLPIADVDASFFRVMGIPMVDGRAFGDQDRLNGPPAIIINEGMARRLWPTGRAVGQRVQLHAEGDWFTVVGVAGNVYQFDHSKPPDAMAIYYPSHQQKDVHPAQTIAIRTATDPEALMPAIRAQVWAIDRDQPIHKFATAQSLYADFFDTPRFYAMLMAIFAGIGAVLAAVGLYSVLAFAMAQRTQEFGVRLALGAQARDVIGLVIRHGVRLTLGGIALGLVGSLFVTRTLGSLLIGVGAADPVTLTAVGVALVSVALLACWVPARRATRVDSIAALRAE